MSLYLSDTQKITNVPSSRDIGSLVNLNDSRDPLANQPTPPLPRIQSGLTTQTDTYNLIDRLDFSSSAGTFFATTKICFPLGNFKRYKLVLEGLDFATANNLFLNFDNQANGYFYEWYSLNGNTGTGAAWGSAAYMQLGNTTSFPINYGGIFGEINIGFPNFNGDIWGSSGAYLGPQTYWTLNCGQYRTNGHGVLNTGSTPLRSIQLDSTYAFTKGTISCYGLPRN